jgi:hypothetical protein
MEGFKRYVLGEKGRPLTSRPTAILCHAQTSPSQKKELKKKKKLALTIKTPTTVDTLKILVRLIKIERSKTFY